MECWNIGFPLPVKSDKGYYLSDPHYSIVPVFHCSVSCGNS